MLKLLVLLLIITIGAYFTLNQIPSLKEQIIEAINPAIKERRILGELKINLDEIDKSLQEAAEQKRPDKIIEKINNSQNLLKDSKSLLNEISKINSNTGLVGSQIGKIIDALSDKMPFSADHQKTTAESSIHDCSCPPLFQN